MALVPLATAALVGSVFVLIADTMLHAALAATKSAALPVSAIVLDRLRWVVAAGLIRVLVSRVEHGSSPRTVSGRSSWTFVGQMAIVLPLVWFTATMVVTTSRMIASGTWRTSARIFLEPYFYSEMIIAYAPWLLAGIALHVVARHAIKGDSPLLTDRAES